MKKNTQSAQSSISTCNKGTLVFPDGRRIAVTNVVIDMTRYHHETKRYITALSEANSEVNDVGNSNLSGDSVRPSTLATQPNNTRD